MTFWNTSTDFNSKEVNLWFYAGRSIGVTLLGIYALEQAARFFLDTKKVKLYLVLRYDQKHYEELLRPYSNIQIVFFNKKHAYKTLKLLGSSFFCENHWIHTPSFSQPSLVVRLISRWLSFGNSRSSVIGFCLKKTFLDKLLYSRAIEIAIEESIFFQVGKIFQPSSQYRAPSLLFCHDAELEKALPRKYIVFHPYATSVRRSYPDSLSKKIILYVKSAYPDYEIILSGGPADFNKAQVLLNELGSSVNVYFIDKFNEENFAKTINIIAKASVYIGVDTGTTHIAAHLNVPTIVLGNYSNPMWLPEYSTFSFNLANKEVCTCNGMKGGDCLSVIDGVTYFRCMANISFDSIKATIDKYLN